MTAARLVFAAIIAVWSMTLLSAQERPMTVCEALNSAKDHQPVVIHAAMAATQHDTIIFEGTGQDPCSGWSKHFFTAPSRIPLFLAPYPGIRVSGRLFRDLLDFRASLTHLQDADHSSQHMVTLSGIIIRRAWPLIFRSADGTYFGFGEGLDSECAAKLVVTSVPIMDQ